VADTKALHLRWFALVGNAKVAGLEKSLNMHGNMYNVAVTLFFVPYTLLEVPSNIVLKLMRPSRWIALLMFFWGLTMTYGPLFSTSPHVLNATNIMASNNTNC